MKTVDRGYILVVTIVLTSLLQVFPAYAEIKTVTHTIHQPFGGSQSPDDARTAGIARAKREALEQFGTYIESTTVVKDSRVNSDEILALTAGVTKAEVIKQKTYADGDAFGIEITVKVNLDTAVLEKSLNRLLADRSHLKDLADSRDREKKLLARIVELEKQNKRKGKTKQQAAELKKKFNNASLGLSAVDWSDKAQLFWDGHKYTDPQKAIEYFTEAIRLDPKYTRAYCGRGLVYFSLEQFDRAIADYDQAIRLEPNDAWAYCSRGNAYYNLKQFDRALADYDQAIRLEPKYAPAYINRGNTYLINLKKVQIGCDDLEKACRLGDCSYYNVAQQRYLCR